MKAKTIIVTGGAGFLGSHLCERLVLRGDHVLCVDNFSSGDRRNIAHLLSHANFELLHHDVSVPLSHDADEIYNLACPASPVYYQRDPVQTLRTSVIGAMNLLELARRRGARILQASTSEVYGDPLAHPQAESYWGNVNPVGLRSCYDEGKRCAETLFSDFRRQYKLATKIVRIFNVYGPRMRADDGRVVSNFITQALSGRSITLYGDGSQTRSFCYVDDLIDGLIRTMETGDDFGGPVNLGTRDEIPIRELAAEVLRQTASSSGLTYLPLPADDPRQRQPDLTLAKARLGWTPTTALADGLAKTIAYFLSLREQHDTYREPTSYRQQTNLFGLPTSDATQPQAQT
ncbi:UDP-glucuronic acid decarboxylase family protein [Paraburkholderia susongensis]|uniref:UDP-glucuronate decarboxylase n=1 Tax=Paraburkholderia susongensis TaxID=1515439 RepID=A0A1X7LKL2_9BURK|nr:UDP-glucuronic acid decarboxylase family protein [Paraburkholderia susongensis]SMG53792.1 UDP-glucuronate decarboxylase [Paraburkholderia susongensis]